MISPFRIRLFIRTNDDYQLEQQYGNELIALVISFFLSFFFFS